MKQLKMKKAETSKGKFLFANERLLTEVVGGVFEMENEITNGF